MSEEQDTPIPELPPEHPGDWDYQTYYHAEVVSLGHGRYHLTKSKNEDNSQWKAEYSAPRMTMVIAEIKSMAAAVTAARLHAAYVRLLTREIEPDQLATVIKFMEETP